MREHSEGKNLPEDTYWPTCRGCVHILILSPCRLSENALTCQVGRVLTQILFPIFWSLADPEEWTSFPAKFTPHHLTRSTLQYEKNPIHRIAGVRLQASSTLHLTSSKHRGRIFLWMQA